MPELSPHEIEAARLRAMYAEVTRQENRAESYFSRLESLTNKAIKHANKKPARRPRNGRAH